MNYILLEELFNRSLNRLLIYCNGMKDNELEFINNMKDRLLEERKSFNNIDELEDYYNLTINDIYLENIDSLSLSSLQLLCKQKTYFNIEIDLYKRKV